MIFARRASSLLKNATQYVRYSSQFSEVRIPVPWGHVAGKWWGPQDKRPVLVMHGWQDNCGSFDMLIPQLPSHLGYLCVDFSGHGYSTRLPPGMFYYGANGLLMVRLIQKFFGWDRVSLMGHSLGAITSFTYSLYFPNDVDFMVCLDGLQPVVHPVIEKGAMQVDNFLKFDEQSRSDKEPPSYTMEEIVNLLHEGTRKSIAKDKCKYILERNITASKDHPGKYYFTRDPRLKCGNLYTWNVEELKAGSARVNFPLMVSIAAETPFFGQHDLYTKTFENLRRLGEKFELHNVPGTHHVHLNEPEVVSGIITDFIKKYDIHDRSIGGLKKEILFNC